MKKKLFIYLIVLFFTTNLAYGANWIQVKANNGKTALLDTQNMEISSDSKVKYWVKNDKNGYTYRHYMMSDCNEQTSCIIETYKYKGGNLVDTNKRSVRLEKIVPDTLNDALYKKVCELRKKNPLVVDSSVWQKYLQSVYTEINSSWKPEYSKTNKNDLSAKIMFEVDKNGKVLFKAFICPSNNDKYDKVVENLLNTISFKPLPYPYEGKVSFIIDFKYAINGKAPKESVKMDKIGFANITVSKSKIHAGEVIVNGLVGIVSIPFVILGCLLTGT